MALVMEFIRVKGNYIALLWGQFTSLVGEAEQPFAHPHEVFYFLPDHRRPLYHLGFPVVLG